jgi:hypothetical protein
MAYGEGGLTATDLLAIGLPVLLIGCAVVALTGGTVLGRFGVP